MREEIIEKVSTLVTAAFGFVAALAWNSAIQAIFARYYKAGEGIISQVIYAVLVTLIAVLFTIWIGRAAERAKKREDILSKHAELLKSRIKKTALKPKR